VTADTPTLRLGDRQVPLVLPSLRDARLHTAAVILTVHTVGITALGFRVSVFQILSAILAAAVVDIAFTFRATGKLVWPASGMLTGSGVALILRLVEMEAGDHWAWTGWHYYAVVAGLSVATKYLIRHRGVHLFNPSNVGLVAAFLIVGSDLIEPLDFWWAPLGPWMIFAYLVILVGGIAITRRLALLEIAVGFWLVLAAGLGILAASGHCMIAAWAPEPLCGGSFWTVLVTSPEVLIFQLFMITDPKTIPAGRRARLAFAVTLGLLATLLIAPQATEYGAKVGLLGSLVILTPVRGQFDRLFAATGEVRPPVGARTAFVHGVGVGFALAVVAFGVVLAGAPAREPARAVALSPAAATEVEVDPATLPPVTTSQEVQALNIDVDPSELAVTLAENLFIEAEAVRHGNGNLLAAAATGDRLTEMQRRVGDAISTGERPVPHYRFDSLALGVAEAGEGQSSAALSFEAIGTEEVITYDALGTELSRTTSEFSRTFVLRRVGGDRWLIAATED
jgi:hypothetical protein